MDVSNHLLKDAEDPRADDTELRLIVEAAITREHADLFGVYPNPHEFNGLVDIRMRKVIAMALDDKNDRCPPVGCHPTEAELNAARDVVRARCRSDGANHDGLPANYPYPPEKANASNLIGSGDEDVLAERGKQWGDTYKQISGDWEELLGVHTTTEQFIAMMIVLKLRRWRNSGYQENDCLTDIIGYAKLGLS